MFLLSGCACPLAAQEFRGLWVDAYHAGFRNARETGQLISDSRKAHFNALLVEVRRRGDALYQSHFEPRADDVSPADYDPLADLIARAHNTNEGPRLEIHAWMVTYPIWDHRTTPPAQTNHPYVLHPDWLTRNVDGATWNGSSYMFDPGHPAVQEHTFNVAMDIVTHYDVDGLNLDYIRYDGVMWGYNPVAVARFNEETGHTGVPSPTDAQWMQWRRDQVTGLVRKIYLSALAIKPHLKISADTICFAPGVTTTTGWTNVSAAYTSVLQDWRSWMEEGILDINIPMVYFDFEGNHRQSWTNWNTFIKDHRYGRQAVIGPGGYLNGISNTLQQIRFTRERTPEGNAADGVALYSYGAPTAENVPRSTFLAALSDADESKLREGHNPPVFAAAVATPAMPWKTAPTEGHLKGQLVVDGSTNRTRIEPVLVSGPGGEILLEPDATGFFGIANAAPGPYRLIAAREGFRPVITDTMVVTGQVATADLRLERLPDGTAPFVAIQPEDRAGQVGDSIRFRSLGAGSPGIAYQWLFEGQPVRSATNSTLVRSSIDFPVAGRYALVLSNAFGTATSEVARLTVSAPEGIYALRSSGGYDSAIVTWRTSEPATGSVEYGTGTNVEDTLTVSWAAKTNHIVRLARLNPNTTYHFRVQSRTATTSYHADGLAFRTAGDTTLDNTAAAFSGGWSSGTSATGHYGSGYRFAGTLRTNATSRATYAPDIQVAGLYDIAVWNPHGSNRSTNAPFVIKYDGGAQLVTVNQSSEGARWRTLAEGVPLARGNDGSVSLSNATGEFGRVVIADAVRFAYRPGQDRPPGEAVPTWWAQHFFGGDVDGAADPDHDLYTTREEFLLGSNPLDPASSIHTTTARAGDGTLHIRFAPVQPDRSYELESSDRLDPADWKVVPAGPGLIGPTGEGEFVTTPPGHDQTIYRVIARFPQEGPERKPVAARLN